MAPHPGKFLILLGGLLIAIGVLWLWGGKHSFIGKLPGDMRFDREHFSFYFPLGTCLLISLLLSLLIWLLRR